MTFGERVIDYYGDLQIKANLPQGVEVLNPYLDDEVMKLCKIFYHKYYNDEIRGMMI